MQSNQSNQQSEPKGANSMKTCYKGHTDNWYSDTRGYQQCRTCRTEVMRGYRKRTPKDKLNKYPLEWRFGGNRQKALQRDNYTCVSCDMTNDEHIEKYNRSITVDHIDGRGRNTDKKYANHDLSNLQTLCLSCHGKKDIERRKTGIVNYART